MTLFIYSFISCLIPEPEKKYFCNKCDVSYTNPKSLQSHVKRTHNTIKPAPDESKRPFECPCCKRRYTTQKIMNVCMFIYLVNKIFHRINIFLQSEKMVFFVPCLDNYLPKGNCYGNIKIGFS